MSEPTTPRRTHDDNTMSDKFVTPNAESIILIRKKDLKTPPAKKQKHRPASKQADRKKEH